MLNTCRIVVAGLLACGMVRAAEAPPAGGAASNAAVRAEWVASLVKVADPVLTALAQEKLHETMTTVGRQNLRRFAMLEATGRLLCGVSAWMDLPADATTAEGRERERLLALAWKGLANGFNPESPDRLNFTEGTQPTVDMAFLAEGFLRAPKRLWGGLDAATKGRILAAMKHRRCFRSWENNWVMFDATMEAFILEQTGACDEKRLRRGVDTFMDRWYKGDSFYGDGQDFQMDYYNSFVIHPMLMDVLTVMARHSTTNRFPDAVRLLKRESVRARRYADILEHFIMPDGSYPAVGRSIAYRFGAFHALAQAALMKNHGVSDGAVRSAMTAVLRRQCGAQNFDAKGFLTFGFNGTQPSAMDGYISAGSPYMCAAFFLPLGLPADDPFWTAPEAPWTSKRAWEGLDFGVDHGIHQ